MIPRVTLVTPRLVPMYLEDEPKRSFHVQLEHLRTRLGSLVEWLPPAPVASAVSAEASAVVIPDLSGVAYRKLEALRAIEQPILVITSEFGTVSMWDWEIRNFLRRRGVPTLAPTSLQEFHDVLETALRRHRHDRLGARYAPPSATATQQPPPTHRILARFTSSCRAALRLRSASGASSTSTRMG
jgi:hypothetical protein